MVVCTCEEEAAGVCTCAIELLQEQYGLLRAVDRDGDGMGERSQSAFSLTEVGMGWGRTGEERTAREEEEEEEAR